jgi:biotin operon repressor
VERQNNVFNPSLPFLAEQLEIAELAVWKQKL